MNTCLCFSCSLVGTVTLWYISHWEFHTEEPSHKVILNSTCLRGNLFSCPLKAKSVGRNGDDFSDFEEITQVHASSSFLPQYFSCSRSENLPLSKALYFGKTSNDGFIMTITILWPYRSVVFWSSVQKYPGCVWPAWEWGCLCNPARSPIPQQHTWTSSSGANLEHFVPYFIYSILRRCQILPSCYLWLPSTYIHGFFCSTVLDGHKSCRAMAYAGDSPIFHFSPFQNKLNPTGSTKPLAGTLRLRTESTLQQSLILPFQKLSPGWWLNVGVAMQESCPFLSLVAVRGLQASTFNTVSPPSSGKAISINKYIKLSDSLRSHQSTSACNSSCGQAPCEI